MSPHWAWTFFFRRYGISEPYDGPRIGSFFIYKHMKFIHWVEEPPKHYLTFGFNAPWLNSIWILVPKFIAKLFN